MTGFGSQWYHWMLYVSFGSPALLSAGWVLFSARLSWGYGKERSRQLWAYNLTNVTPTEKQLLSSSKSPRFNTDWPGSGGSSLSMEASEWVYIWLQKEESDSVFKKRTVTWGEEKKQEGIWGQDKTVNRPILIFQLWLQFILANQEWNVFMPKCLEGFNSEFLNV